MVEKTRMKHYPDITMTLTMGSRPVELEKTLTSILSQASFAHIVGVNDFRDEPTNAVFRRLCPTGTLIVPEQQLGHHGAIDVLYAAIQTPYVFHCEDDWFFEQTLNLDFAKRQLDRHPEITALCFRKLEDNTFTAEQRAKIQHHCDGDFCYYRLDALDKQWHGYGFNPHLIKLETLRSIGRFSGYKKERHISRQLRAQGKFIAMLDPGVCHHIGEVSMANPPAKSRWEAIRRKIFG